MTTTLITNTTITTSSHYCYCLFMLNQPSCPQLLQARPSPEPRYLITTVSWSQVGWHLRTRTTLNSYFKCTD